MQRKASEVQTEYEFMSSDLRTYTGYFNIWASVSSFYSQQTKNIVLKCNSSDEFETATLQEEASAQMIN